MSPNLLIDAVLNKKKGTLTATNHHQAIITSTYDSSIGSVGGFVEHVMGYRNTSMQDEVEFKLRHDDKVLFTFKDIKGKLSNSAGKVRLKEIYDLAIEKANYLNNRRIIPTEDKGLVLDIAGENNLLIEQALSKYEKYEDETMDELLRNFYSLSTQGKNKFLKKLLE